MSGGNVDTVSGTFEVLRASNNSTGFRYANTNLPATTIIQSTYFNLTNLTNTNTVDAMVEVKFNFGDSYMWIADGDLRVRVYGEILRNGTVVQTTAIAHYNWLDSEPFNNAQQQTEMRINGVAFNDVNIIAAPNDIITARQYITSQAISGGNGNERIYVYNGQSVILMTPKTMLI